NGAGEPVRIHRLSLADERLTPITPEGIGSIDSRVTPDGRFVISTSSDLVYSFYPVDGGNPIPVPGLAPLDRPAAWANGGKGLYVHEPGSIPARPLPADLE